MQDVVIGIVQNGERFAFLQRMNDTWTFPSGKVEENEDLEDAVLREICEETGLKATIIGKCGSREIDDTILHYFHCTVRCAFLNIAETDKFKQARWYTCEEIVHLAGDRLYQPIRDYLYYLKMLNAFRTLERS